MNVLFYLCFGYSAKIKEDDKLKRLEELIHYLWIDTKAIFSKS